MSWDPALVLVSLRITVTVITFILHRYSKLLPFVKLHCISLVCKLQVELTHVHRHSVPASLTPEVGHSTGNLVIAVVTALILAQPMHSIATTLETLSMLLPNFTNANVIFLALLLAFYFSFFLPLQRSRGADFVN
jgi:hypothetical protein